MEFSLDRYRIAAIEDVVTPALAVYPEMVSANIDAMLGQMGGDADRWRPHVKTSKLGFVMHMMAARGVVNVKCSTTLELITAIEAGAKDALVAYAMVGANARRVRAIAAAHPETKVSVLVENESQAANWHGTGIGMFIDVNPGMNRTGIGQERIDAVVTLARAIGGQFRGLHYYDGHMSNPDRAERERASHAGYDRLMELVAAVNRGGGPVEEVITSGTPAFPYGLSYAGFRGAGFVHRVSPGTTIYNDFTSLAQLPGEFGLRPGGAGGGYRRQPSAAERYHLRRGSQSRVGRCGCSHVSGDRTSRPDADEAERRASADRSRGRRRSAADRQHAVSAAASHLPQCEQFRRRVDRGGREDFEARTGDGSRSRGAHPMKTDEELAQLLVAGQEGAFEEFVATYRQKVFQYSFSMCGQREDAEEVAQETLLSVFQHLDQMRDPAHLKAWVFRIAKNACLMKRRKSMFAPPAEDPLDDIDATDDGPEPDRVVLEEERKHMLCGAILALPEIYRSVVLLRDVEELSTEETAEVLGVSEDVVKTRLKRARRGLARRTRNGAAGRMAPGRTVAAGRYLQAETDGRLAEQCSPRRAEGLSNPLE